MAAGHATFTGALDQRTEDMANACVACGKCFETCPTARAVGIDDLPSEEVTKGVRGLLRGKQGAPAAERWVELCTSSGICTSVCEYGINPRFMISMARAALQARRNSGADRRERGRRSFQAMSRGVRTLARLQLSPEALRRISPDADAQDTDAAVTFYTGCNVLKTPHIVLLCLDVFDALGISYTVAGGPSCCCGVLQFRAGDMSASERLSNATIGRLAPKRGAEVVSWCPSCQVQLNEVALPNRGDRAPFELVPFVRFLQRNLVRLRELMVHPVRKRVGLHEHPGIPGVAGAVRQILKTIPSLEFVDLPQPQLGLMCATMNGVPDLKRDTHADLLARAQSAGVDTLAGVYHACHRELCAHEAAWPFEVVNFMELIGASMGIEREDVFKRLKMLGDVEAVLAESAALIETHQLDPDQVREVVARDLLGEQTLPVRPPPGS